MIKPTIISIVETTSHNHITYICPTNNNRHLLFCAFGKSVINRKKKFILKLKTALGLLTLVSSHWEDLEIKCFGKTLDQNY